MLDAIETPPDAEFLYDESEPAGALRRRNLIRYLDLTWQSHPTVMLLSEAPGYRGTTITGVPFMSIRQLSARPGFVTGDADGDGFELPVAAGPEWEASSTTMWAALAGWRAHLPLLWGIYPNHPHLPGNLTSNRPPRPAEVRAGTPIAFHLAELFGISEIVAVGRKAQGALTLAGIEAPAIRHPAQGGARQFTEQLAALAPRA
jgi:hypothetical protein